MIKRTRSLTSRLIGLPNIASDVKVGFHATIGAGARVGSGSHLGNWTKVGSGAHIGERVKFGDWTQIGEGAQVGDGVVFGSHTRVQPGVVIPDGAVLEDCDLVTKDGIIPNRSSGSASRIEGDHYVSSGQFGQFRIPKDYRPTIQIPWNQDDEEGLFFGGGGSDAYENARAIDYLGKLIDAYMSGLTDEIEQFRTKEPEGGIRLLSIEDRQPVALRIENSGFVL